MATNESLKNQITNKKTGEVPLTPAQQVSSYLKAYEGTFQQIAPKHFNTERFQRIALSEIRKNPKLLECSVPSLMSAVLQSVKLGLEPGLFGQAYLIPYGKEVQFQIGYRGLIELSQRSGRILKIQAREVYENDEFEVSYGIDDNIIHKPALDVDRGKVRLYYAVAWFKDGGAQFELMSISDVEKHRDKFSKTAKFGPWKDHFDEMAKKTVLKKLVKQLPMDVEFQEAVQEDETVRKTITDEPEILQAEFEIVDQPEISVE
ncbi:recombination protein RecT [Bacillus sp. AFS017336]|uniref:recombination protein RecT n=1 Tax=Bacillus sp. AFS017336 TaxID=2033489 RepID=UPI000BF1EAEF|nr:recombination protein RecT [Bacillus sp. AFS017336]PEL12691.1 recombinase RecT [Bacillus sp. AFS017336]